MPTLELTLLQTLPSIDPQDTSILTNLISVRSALASQIHNTNSRFYRSFSDPSLIYILGLWDSVSQHQEFLASERCSEILAPQEGLMSFRWGLHVELESDEITRRLRQAEFLGIAKAKGDERSVKEYVNDRAQNLVLTAPVEGSGHEEWAIFFAGDEKEYFLGWEEQKKVTGGGTFDFRVVRDMER